MRIHRIAVMALAVLMSCQPAKKEPAKAEATTVAAKNITGEEISYAADNITMKGFIAYDAAQTGKRPGVIVVHEWWGHNEYARQRAKMLAEMGYVALAVDMYGDGKKAEHPQDAGKFASETMKNFKGAKARFEKAVETLKNNPNVDASHIAAIGYCFGGGVVLNMARQGIDMKAVVSFHGSLGAAEPAKEGVVKSRVLVCNGAADKSATYAESQPARARVSGRGGGEPINRHVAQLRACIHTRAARRELSRSEREGGAGAELLPGEVDAAADARDVDVGLAEAALRGEVTRQRFVGHLGLDVDDDAAAVEDFVDGVEAGLDGEAHELDAVGGLGLPAGRAGRQDVQEAEAGDAERVTHLAHRVLGVRERDRSRVGDAVRGHDRQDVFLLDVLAVRRGGGRGAERCGRRALPAGVAVDLVVVTEVEDVLVALGGGREGRHADVVGAAVSRPAEDAGVLAVEARGVRETRGDRGGGGEGRGDHGCPVRGVREGSGRHDRAARGDDELHGALGDRVAQEVEPDGHAAAAAVGVAGAQDRLAAVGRGLRHAAEQRLVQLRGTRGHGVAHQPTSTKRGASARARERRSSSIPRTCTGRTSPPPRPAM